MVPHTFPRSCCRSYPPRWPRADLDTRSSHATSTSRLLIGLVASVGFPLLGSAQAGGTSAPAATRPSRGPDPAVAEYFATHVDKEEMVRIPMRDGVRLNGTLFFAKGQPRTNLPTVLVFFPYQINGVSAENEQLLEHGYAIAYVNARVATTPRGRYAFLTGSGNDSYDTIDWLAAQPWSNGKVGALGCSSSAGRAAQDERDAPSRLRGGGAARLGCRIGKVGPYNEMGNFYRGGAIELRGSSGTTGPAASSSPRSPRTSPRADAPHRAHSGRSNPRRFRSPRVSTP